jgi:hypothetical protein
MFSYHKIQRNLLAYIRAGSLPSPGSRWFIGRKIIQKNIWNLLLEKRTFKKCRMVIGVSIGTWKVSGEKGAIVSLKTKKAG